MLALAQSTPAQSGPFQVPSGLARAESVAASAAGAASSAGFWTSWFRRSDQAKREQPHWMTPMATTTPRLEQEFRYDVLWQQARPGVPYTENIGNSKGLELIPLDGLEVIASVPPYLIHHSASSPDGFGDVQMLVKYRVRAEDEAHGNYILTVFFASTFPTGGSNGQTDAVVTPTLAYGKGYGPFDLQGTLGAGLPTGNEAAIGRTYAWNNTVQYHLGELWWFELEANATWYQDGKNGGKEQTYLTPGLVVGRIPLGSRLKLAVGAAMQFAISQFHTSVHSPIVSVRLPF